jgi:DNA-binding transcriptional ArsR family regulator
VDTLPSPVKSFNATDVPPVTPEQVAPEPTPQPKPARSAPMPKLDGRKTMEIISERTRYRILRELCTGRLLASVQLAELVHADQRVVSKHLIVLRKAGLLYEQAATTDARYRLHGIRPVFLKGEEDGKIILDWGGGLVRFLKPVDPELR